MAAVSHEVLTTWAGVAVSTINEKMGRDIALKCLDHPNPDVRAAAKAVVDATN